MANIGLDALSKILSFADTVAAFMAHIHDAVPAAGGAAPLVRTAKQQAADLRDMHNKLAAEDQPAEAQTEQPDEDLVDIPPGHDAELDALRAVADEKGVSYSARTRAAGLRKLLGMGPDDPVTVPVQKLPEDTQAQVLKEADAADNSADELNKEEADKHAADA